MLQLSAVLVDALSRKFALHQIKRDAYLGNLLSLEIEYLSTEVTFPNSPAVLQLMNQRTFPNRKKLTVELEIGLDRRINEVLTEKNILRDAWVNRILFFIVAEKPILDKLKIKYDRRVGSVTGSLNSTCEQLLDPFAHIRSANEGRFYTLTPFPDHRISPSIPNLFALNVAISKDEWASIIVSDDDFFVELTAPSHKVETTTSAAKHTDSSDTELIAILSFNSESASTSRSTSKPTSAPGPMSSAFLPMHPTPPTSTSEAKGEPGPMSSAFLPQKKKSLR